MEDLKRDMTAGISPQRIFREEDEADSNLFDEWHWSEWYPVMASGRLRYKLTDWHDRAEHSPGIRIRQKTLDELFSEECYGHTVYEIMMVRGTLRVPVYIGETPRNVSKRIGEYCTNGSNIKYFNYKFKRFQNACDLSALISLYDHIIINPRR